MRAKIKVQEQMVDAIFKKNISYVEHELKNLRNVDYSMFNEANKWLKMAKVKLDNFQANNENPNYIAFDMLANAKQANDDFNDADEDNLLDNDEHKNTDIIVHGEKIADFLGQVKTINPNLLASQLNQLNLVFDDKLIDQLTNYAKCTAIEGVEVSTEELEAIQEAAHVGQDGLQDMDIPQSTFNKIVEVPKPKVAEVISAPPKKAGGLQGLPSNIGKPADNFELSNLQKDMEALTMQANLR